MFKEEFFLAYAYLRFHRLKTVILSFSFTVIIALPILLEQLQGSLEALALERAESTALILGAKGSSLDLALHALYFNKNDLKPSRFGLQAALERENDLDSIPLHLRFTAQSKALVGTTESYFEKRLFKAQKGIVKLGLGDCILGATVAEELSVKLGDYLKTDIKDAFDFMGQYPLDLRVVGILANTGSADDEVVFTSLETAWTVEGIGHGHDEIFNGNHDKLGKKYHRIDPTTRSKFHFHGSKDQFPVTALLLFPQTEKAKVLALGKFRNDLELQIIESEEVIGKLISLLLKVKAFFKALLIPVYFSAFLLIFLILLLTWKSRENERASFVRLGCSRAFFCRQSLCELFLILLPSCLFVWLFSFLLSCFKLEILKLFLAL